jgi:hypothetical protein
MLQGERMQDRGVDVRHPVRPADTVISSPAPTARPSAVTTVCRMGPRTSGTRVRNQPSIPPEAAFQGKNGDLFFAFSPGASSSDTALTNVDTGLAMAPGTNPAIAWDGANYQIAFQGLNGHLWLYSSVAGVLDTEIVMAPGSSASIG